MESVEVDAVIENLRLVGTDKQRVEVKSNLGKSVLEMLSAFSNGDGGLLIVGLNEADNFALVPGFNAKRERDRLVQYCLSLTPTVRPSVDLVPFEGNTLLVAEVDPMVSHDKPCYVTERGRYGGSYIRTGDGDLRLQKYEIDRLIEERTQPAWDAEVILEASKSDLDEDLLESFARSQKKQRPKTFAHGESVALQRLWVMKEGCPTLAGLLAMGAFPQEFFPRLNVTFSEFPGTSKGDVLQGLRLLDRATFEGPIPEIVEKVVEKVQSNMRTAGQIEGVYRKDLPDYPLVAVREAIVNALMHRDYSPDARGTQVQVNMFVDRLEITSPGGLYGAVTLRTLGEAGLSSTRNQRLAALLETVNVPGGGPVAENRGTGIAVMQSELSKSLMPPPEFRDDLASFTVVFRRRHVAPSERYMAALERVRHELVSRETASTSELMEILGLSRTSVQNAINKLIGAGVVQATEPPKSPLQRYRFVRD